ncbi:MAG TPA: hypothetical protein P5079_10550, partial [Elusimicrobiota bacterium]|nr:hypothetical protein [Elusimicrobiota bacterium]
ATFSTTEDMVDKSELTNDSYSVSVNVEIVRNILYSQIWGSMISTEDDDALNLADRQDTSANIEFTYQVKSNTALTLGAYRNVTKDKIAPVNDTTANGGNARVSYSF